MIKHADVLFENFTPGTLERWGLGWDEVKKINPKIIMVRVSGYGQVGPYRKRSGYDRIALGFSGYMYPTGFPDRFPVRVGVFSCEERGGPSSLEDDSGAPLNATAGVPFALTVAGYGCIN